MQKQFKKIPTFRNEAQEAEFWSTHDSTEYIDWNKAIINPTFANLKPSTRSITLRVSESMIKELKMLANKKDVPYQSLVKIFLDEKIREELKPASES